MPMRRLNVKDILKKFSLRTGDSSAFTCSHNEPLSVSMRVNNPDCSPLGINGRDPAQPPTGFLEIVSNSLPVFHDSEMAWSRVACSRCSETSSRGTKRSAANQCWNNYRIVQMSDSKNEVWYQMERHTQVAASRSSKELRGTWGCVHLATRADKRSVRA